MTEAIEAQSTDSAAEFLKSKDQKTDKRRNGNPYNHVPKAEMLTTDEIPEWLPTGTENLKEFVYAWLIKKFIEPMEISTLKEAQTLVKEALDFRPTFNQRVAAATSGDLLDKVRSNPALMAALKAELGVK